MRGIGRPTSGAVNAAATGKGDIKLRRLWWEFIRRRAAYRAAWERYQSMYEAFVAELPPCPEGVRPGDHMRAQNWLWRKHGLEEPWNAWNSATEAMEATFAAILAVEAEGLLGIGIKLAALPVGFELDSDDLEEARDVVLMDIERLMGITLEEAVSRPMLTLVPDPIFAAIADHQAKSEAVRAHDDNLNAEPAPGDSTELPAALAASIAARKTLD
jgi:hypothetical protein